MPYGAMLHVLLLGLAVHYFFIANVPLRFKLVFAPLILLLMILYAWIPPSISMLLELAASVGILIAYRIRAS